MSKPWSWRTGAGAAIVFLALVLAFATALRSAHDTAQRDLADGFAERAKVTAALTQSLFESSSASAKAMDRRLYGATRVSRAALSAQAAANRSSDLLLLASDGSVLATSANTPAVLERAVRAKPDFVRAALAGQAFALSDVMALGPHLTVIQYAQPFDTRFGRRVLVSGFQPSLLSGFIGGYLAGAATTKNGQAFVIDGRGSIIASAGSRAPRGLLEESLRRAVVHETHGNFGRGSYFAASSVRHSRWRVVVTSPARVLFASVEGLSIWVPRLLFTAFVLAVIVALALAGRALRAAAAQRAADTRLRTALDERLQLAALVDSSIDAIISKSLDGTITSWNPAAQKLYGYSAEECLGKPIDLLVPPGYAAEAGAIMDRVKAGESVQTETKRVAKDGHVIDIALTVSPVRGADGGIVGACAIARDITERKRGDAELVLAHERALEASRSKSEFVANMSHEIRTPLNGVIGMTDLLRETSLDQVQRDYVDALNASGEALLAVVSDVLDFSKIEAGRLELDPAAFDLRASVEQACEMLAGQAHGKGVHLSHWVDADVPATVHGDSARLRQILLNLLSNAVKFTASGEVVLRVRRDGDELLHFAVADTGVGIDPAQASRLFEAFRQADQSTTRRYGGTGLGLAISSRLVHLLGGEIGVEPAAGRGSVFWFTARLPAVAGAAEPNRACPELHGLRALIVDDIATNRTIFEHYLRAWGLACESVPTARAALEAMERTTQEGQGFEVAVLDDDLPDMSGLELVREIRKRPTLRSLRIVMVSSVALERKPFNDLDVAAILSKPPRQSGLYNAILAAISGASTSRREPAAPKTIATPRGPLVLVAEDNEINRTLARALLGKHGLRAAIAHNGREAVDMALANDYSAILMDCQMPEMDGYQATQLIRERESGRHVPIIAMTAHSMSGDRERCLAAGMDDYLSKPIRAEELEGIIERWMRADAGAGNDGGMGTRAGGMGNGTGGLGDGAGGAGNGAGGSPNGGDGAGDGSGAHQVELLDEASVSLLEETFAPEQRAQLLDTFAQQLQTCVQGIISAVQLDDYAERRRLAHLLKGSCATLGAQRLRALCETLEHDAGPGAADRSDELVAQLHATAQATRDALEKRLR